MRGFQGRIGLAAVAGVFLVQAAGCASLFSVTKVKTQGFGSPFARAHAGQVVFSKAEIPHAPKADALTNRFTLQDPIRLRPLFRDSFFNVLAAKGLQFHKTSPAPSRRFSVRVQVNGETNKRNWIWVDSNVPSIEEVRTWTTYSPQVNYKTSLTSAVKPGDTESPAYEFATRVVPKLHVGDNEITVHVFGEARVTGPDGYADAELELASGTFTLQVAPGDLERFAKTKGPRLEPSPNPDNARLVALFKKTLAEKWPDETFIGAVTRSKMWFVKLSRISGRPLQRSVEAQVVLRHQGKKTCRVFGLAFIERYAGTGNNYLDHMEVGVGGSTPFPCAAAPK